MGSCRKEARFRKIIKEKKDVIQKKKIGYRNRNPNSLQLVKYTARGLNSVLRF